MASDLPLPGLPRHECANLIKECFLSVFEVMVAPYTVVGDSFRADPPQIWSPTSVRGVSSPAISYDPHPDGKRLAAVAAQGQASGVQDKVVFVFNFADYRRKIAPGTK
jgi:hypothetical protein